MRRHWDPLISKQPLIISRVLLVSITKSDEQSPPGYPTHPRSLRQETLRIALAHIKTPTLALPEPNSQLRRKATPARRPSRARDPTQTITRASPEPPLSLPGYRTRTAPGPPVSPPQPAAPGPRAAPVTPSHQDRSAPPSSILNPTPDDLHPPYPPRYPPPPPSPTTVRPKRPPPLRDATRRKRQGHRSPKRTPPPTPQKKANGEHHPPQGAARGVRGVVPPEEHCEPPARGLKGPEHRATPGGYGGKPPGVAIIGVPTGARNAGSDAPTGDQSIDMNRTRKHPPVCQDPITTRSRDEPEQAQSPAD